MIRNAIVFILALASYYMYLTEFSGNISLEQRMLVNFVIVPVSIGAMATLLLSGTLQNRILITALIPIAPILFFGDDSAKSGMGLIIIGPLVAMFAIGAVAGGALEGKRKARKRGRRE